MNAAGGRDADPAAGGRGVTPEDAERDFTKDISSGRANDPKNMAAMAVFLSGPGARNITEQTYNVDCGIIPR